VQRLEESPGRGNGRERETVLERAVVLAPGPTLEVAPDFLSAPALPPPAEDGTPPAGAGAEAPAVVQPVPGQPLPRLEAVERDYILTVLRHTNWVITGPRGAAKVLGLNPSTLRSRMKKLGIPRSPR